MRCKTASSVLLRGAAECQECACWAISDGDEGGDLSLTGPAGAATGDGTTGAGGTRDRNTTTGSTEIVNALDALSLSNVSQLSDDCVNAWIPAGTVG